jgi:hypothetical protein
MHHGETGTITIAEFRAGLRSLQLQITPEQLEDLISSIDQDGNGNLDYTEFVEQFQIKALKHKSSALTKLLYGEEERLGYHDDESVADSPNRLDESGRIVATADEYDHQCTL